MQRKSFCAVKRQPIYRGTISVDGTRAHIDCSDIPTIWEPCGRIVHHRCLRRPVVPLVHPAPTDLFLPLQKTRQETRWSLQQRYRCFGRRGASTSLILMLTPPALFSSSVLHCLWVPGCFRHSGRSWHIPQRHP